MFKTLIVAIMNLWNNLQESSQPVIDFLLSEINIFGTNVSVISLFFGAGIAIYLGYQIITWIANIIT